MFVDHDLSAGILGYMKPIPETQHYAKNPVGMADLEANLAGLSFWDTFFPIGGGKVTKKFNICDYVTAKWDENKNPNVPKDKMP